MMKERRLSRSIAMQLLYQWEQQGLLLRKNEIAPSFIKNVDVASLLGHFLYNFYPKDKTAIDMPFIIDIIKGTVSSLARIDNSIDDAGSKWKISRMDAIDRAILRMACYELVVKAELSAKVVINEAVEIAKRYGSEHSPAFINGVLDSINDQAQGEIEA